jgi:hypothetical protein
MRRLATAPNQSKITGCKVNSHARLAKATRAMADAHRARFHPGNPALLRICR